MTTPLTPASPPATAYSDALEFHEPVQAVGHQPAESDFEDDFNDEPLGPPVHPVPAMQAAFEESIDEVSDDGLAARHGLDGADAGARRQRLLDQGMHDNSWTARWNQRQSAKHHPLVKQVAQIIFGMHLLQQQRAASDEAVVNILQTHVDEIDAFLETTTEDFDLAIGDIEERMRFLKVAMSHRDVFETMLEDKVFRTQLLEGNDKIEMIIGHTAKATQGAMLDIGHGRAATKELGKYLDGVRDGWPSHKQDLAPIYPAMKGNEDGWLKAMKDLETKGRNLECALDQLNDVIVDMEKLAGAASRRDKVHARKVSSTSEPASPTLRSKFCRDPTSHPPSPDPRLLHKPLPGEPDASAGARRSSSTISKPHLVPFAKRYESPRQLPPTPPRSPKGSGESKSSQSKSSLAERPKTAGPRMMTARSARANTIRETADLVDFLKHSGPLNSNPPQHPTGPGYIVKGSKKQGSVDVMSVTKMDGTHIARSASFGATAILSPKSYAGAGSANGPTAARNLLPDRKASMASVDGMGAKTNFARRLSKRLRGLPIAGQHRQAPQMSRTPPHTPSMADATESSQQESDSAYCSGSNTKTSSPVEKKIKMTGSLALFPHPSQPLGPTSTTFQSKSHSFTLPAVLEGPGSPANANTNGITALPPALSSPTGVSFNGSSRSRNLTLRNVFHRKQKSGMNRGLGEGW